MADTYIDPFGIPDTGEEDSASVKKKIRKFGRDVMAPAKKVDAFLRKYSGGDYYNRKTGQMREALERNAPKTAEAMRKTADVLGTGAAYDLGGGPMLGMARKARAVEKAEEAVVRRAAKKPVKPKTPVKASGLKPKAQEFKEKLERVGVKNADKRARANVTSDTGTPTSKARIEDAKRSRGPYPVPAIRKENLPAKADVGGRALVKYKGPGLPAKFSDKGRALTVVRRDAPKRSFVKPAIAGGAALTAGGYYATKEIERRNKANAAANQGVDRSGKSDREIVPIKMIEKERLRKIQAARAAQKPKLRPVAKAGKSKTRIAFEKEFAKKRAEAKRRGNPDKGVFTFRGKRYNTKLAK